MTELPISENREFNIEYYGKMKYEQGKKDGIKEEKERIIRIWNKYKVPMTEYINFEQPREQFEKELIKDSKGNEQDKE